MDKGVGEIGTKDDRGGKDLGVNTSRQEILEKGGERERERERWEADENKPIAGRSEGRQRRSRRQSARDAAAHTSGRQNEDVSGNDSSLFQR